MHLSAAVSVLLSVLSLAHQVHTVPVKTTLQKVGDRENSDDAEEPFYAYVYEYEDSDNQIWSDCSQDQSVLKIKSIELDPNPPQKGEAITVSVKAELFEQLDGGTVAVLIKYRGIITVINKIFQICDLAEAVQKTCPIEEGDHLIEVTETFPSYAPSGTYVGVVTATDSSGKKIACVSLDIYLG